MELEIYTQSGILRAIVCPDDNSTHQKTVMGENVVNVAFTVSRPVDFDVNDYVDFCGERYTLLSRPHPEQESTIEYKYTLNFYGIENELSKAICFLQDGESLDSDFSLTDSPAAHLQLVVNNINRIKGTGNWKVGSVIDSDYKAVTYDGIDCLTALNRIAETFETEWWIVGTTIYLSKCEHGELLELGYAPIHAEAGGLLSFSKREEENRNFFTRLYAKGSTRNIDRSKYGSDNLRLPAPLKYLENNTQYGIVEREVIFDDIYPQRIGTVSGVRSVERETKDGKITVYYIKDSGLDFNPNDYEIAGLVKHIHFETGELSGFDFEANYDASTEEFELINQYPDDGTQIPGGVLVPGNGDKYILYNIRMPDEYYPLAEQELLEKATEYLGKYSVDNAVYSGESDPILFKKRNLLPDIGQRVRLYNNVFFPEGYRDSRIIAFSRSLNNPYEVKIDVGEYVSIGRFESLERQVASILPKASGGDLDLNIIKAADTTTVPTDFNVFSALASISRFLRKDQPDATRFLIRLLGGAICDNLASQDFTSGPFGTGYVLKQDKKTGHSYLEIDELYVRLKAYFDTLEIKHLSHVGGRIVISPASMECDRVEVMSGEFEQLFDSAGDIITDSNGEEILAKRNASGSKFYRCYFKQKDDEKEIVNEFAVGDQAQCREFNVKTGISHNVSNQYYWRKVIAVGEDYIDLSVTDCDPISMEPKAGDTIVTIGNDRDINRQNVIVLSSYDNDAPSIKQYAGINSYSMQNKEVTVLSPFGNMFTGKMVIQNGSTGYENFEDKPDLDGIRQDASDALQAASDAQDSVNDAMNAVSDLNEYVDGAFADGIITEAEAQAIEKYINTVNSTKQEVESTYNVLYANTYLQGTAKTNLLNAKITFMGKVEELINAINIAIEDRQTTVEEKQNVDRKFDEFNDAYADMSKAIEDANKSIQDVLKSYSDEAKDMISSVMGQIGKVDQATKDEMAKLLGFTDFAQLEEWAQTGRTIISGGMINTRLIKADAIVTTALIASAIRANTLNVNNKFIVKTDGSVDMSGILHSLGERTELIISDGYVRIAYNGKDVARFSVNEDTGQPEIDMKWGTKSLHASPSDLTFGLGNGDVFLVDPALIGSGKIFKDEKGYLYVSEEYGVFYTVSLYSSPKEGGKTSPFSGPALREQGYRETISAIPNEGYRFDRWSDGGAQTHDVVWQEDVDITAYFVKEEEDYFTVTTHVSPADGGTVTGGGSYPPGKSVQLVAKANSGYVFSQWDDGVTTIDRYITVNKNYDLTAYFIKDSSQEGNLLLTNDDKYYTILQGSESDFTRINEVIMIAAKPTPSGMVLAINKGYLQNKIKAGKRYRFSMKPVGGKGTGKIITLVGAFNPSYPNDLDNFNFVGDDAIKPLYNIPSTTSDPGYGIYEFTFTADRTSTTEDSVIFIMEFGGAAITNQSSPILFYSLTLEAL